MKINVIRQACCSQDDQLWPLKINIELDESFTIQDLAKSIGEAKFLQFSGTHNIIYAWSGNVKLFSIPALGTHDSKVEYFVKKSDLASSFIKESIIKCVW